MFAGLEDLIFTREDAIFCRAAREDKALATAHTGRQVAASVREAGLNIRWSGSRKSQRFHGEWGGMFVSNSRYRRYSESQVEFEDTGMMVCMRLAGPNIPGWMKLGDKRIISEHADWDFALIPPKTMFRNYGEKVECTQHFLNVRFPEPFLKQVESMERVQGLRPDCYKSDPAISMAGKQMAQALADGETDQLYLDSLGMFFFSGIMRNANGPAKPQAHENGGLSPHVLRRVQELMLEHLDEPLSLETIATEAGYSVFHFSRAFKTSTGSAPHAWRIQKRIERAYEMLRRTEMSVTEVALAVGYDSSQALARAFRRQHGQSPSEVRKISRDI